MNIILKILFIVIATIKVGISSDKTKLFNFDYLSFRFHSKELNHLLQKKILVLKNLDELAFQVVMVQHRKTICEAEFKVEDFKNYIEAIQAYKKILCDYVLDLIYRDLRSFLADYQLSESDLNVDKFEDSIGTNSFNSVFVNRQNSNEKLIILKNGLGTTRVKFKYFDNQDILSKVEKTSYEGVVEIYEKITLFYSDGFKFLEKIDHELLEKVRNTNAQQDLKRELSYKIIFSDYETDSEKVLKEYVKLTR